MHLIHSLHRSIVRCTCYCLAGVAAQGLWAVATANPAVVFSGKLELADTAPDWDGTTRFFLRDTEELGVLIQTEMQLDVGPDEANVPAGCGLFRMTFFSMQEGTLRSGASPREAPARFRFLDIFVSTLSVLSEKFVEQCAGPFRP